MAHRSMVVRDNEWEMTHTVFERGHLPLVREGLTQHTSCTAVCLSVCGAQSVSRSLPSLRGCLVVIASSVVCTVLAMLPRLATPQACAAVPACEADTIGCTYICTAVYMLCSMYSSIVDVRHETNGCSFTAAVVTLLWLPLSWPCLRYGSKVRCFSWCVRSRRNHRYLCMHVYA